MENFLSSSPAFSYGGFHVFLSVVSCQLSIDFDELLLLVQCGRNNLPVKKCSNAYCKSFLPFCLVTERVEVLPSCTSN